MHKFTTAIFDMDGVVIDSGPLYSAGDTEFLKRRGVEYNRAEIKDMLVGRNLHEGTGVMQERYSLPGILEDLFQERKSLLLDQFKKSVTFIPGFEQFHSTLKSQGFKTCIATASNDEILTIIDQKLNLTEIFSGHVYKVSQVGNKSKPDPAIFLFAASQTGSGPEECFVIEDAPRGIEAAKKAQMFCIALATTFTTKNLTMADVIVNSYTEIDLNKL